jgi:sterol desaturase/sphingolipid hydroxylase (fatty acid hydroxylase superfamily)
MMVSNELTIRLGFYFGIFVVMSLLELLAPRRRLTTSKAVRWLNNITVTFLGSALVRIFAPLGAVGAAAAADAAGWGLFNHTGLPVLMEGITVIVLLDMLIYWQHVIFHVVGPFWKLHMMHHADMDIDVTTGARFHPVEILLSMIIKMAAVVLLGAPAWSVLAFEVILNGTAMFNHSNFALPLGIDRVLRTVIVTPDMHRVHHSVIIGETNSNYGFNLSVWDRLFGTYRDQPVKGHTGMTIGLANFRDPSKLRLSHMLLMPLGEKTR